MVIDQTNISDTLFTSLPCRIKQEDGSEGCGSSDAMAIYRNGPEKYSAHCFSCNENQYKLTEADVDDWSQHAGHNSKDKSKRKGTLMGGIEVVKGTKVIEEGTFRPLTDRGIYQNVCEFYGVKTLAKDNDIKKHLYPFFTADGNLASVKTRTVSDKSFSWKPEGVKGLLLFGQQKFTFGGKYVTITEGELDALAAYQMFGQQWPVVSLRDGAPSAKSSVLKNPDIYKFLDSYETIVLSFDNDENGIKAAKDFAEIFPHKTKIMTHRAGFKDACDYLRAGKGKEYVQDFYNAQKYVPASLVLSSTLMNAVISGEAVKDAISFPYSDTDNLIFGLRKGELITVTAGSGVGKSAFIREVAMHIWRNTSTNIGIMMLEENNDKTAMGLVGIYMNKPLIMVDLDRQRPEDKKLLRHIKVDDEERRDATKKVLGDDRFVLYNHFGSNDIDVIVNKVKQMHKIYGCQYIFLDHISIVVSAQEGGDERKQLDEVMTKLRMLVEETKITLFVVSHLKRPEGKGHEEGSQVSVAQLRGSAGIGQLSDIILGLERNQQAPDEFMRNVTLVRVLKCRLTGLTGPSSYLYWDKDTGRLVEIDKEEIETRQKQVNEDKSITNADVEEDYEELK